MTERLEQVVDGKLWKKERRFDCMPALRFLLLLHRLEILRVAEERMGGKFAGES